MCPEQIIERFPPRLVNLALLAARLNSLAEIFKNDVADHSGNHGDGEIRGGENIVDGECESLSLRIRMLEFAHQEIGIKQEDDETNLDQRPPNRGDFSGPVGIRRHPATIAKNESRSADLGSTGTLACVRFRLPESKKRPGGGKLRPYNCKNRSPGRGR